MSFLLRVRLVDHEVALGGYTLVVVDVALELDLVLGFNFILPLLRLPQLAGLVGLDDMH